MKSVAESMRDGVSIEFCVPYWRGATFLREALRSVLEQTVGDWRCTVVDDAGPDDDARDIVASFGDRRIACQRNTRNLGLAGNWNRCLAIARAPLVTLLHADDMLRPGYAAAMTALAAEAPDATAMFCRADIVASDGSPSTTMADSFKAVLHRDKGPTALDGERGLARLMHGNFVVCPTLCYRRAAMPVTSFDARWRMVLDLDWMARTLLAGGRLVGSPQRLYAYRRHDANQTVLLTADNVRFREEIELHHELAQRCASRGWSRAAAAASGMRSVRLHLLYRMALGTVAGSRTDVVALARVLKTSFRPAAAPG